MCDDDDDDGISLHGWARVTYTLHAVMHSDADDSEWDPDERTLSFTSIIPDPGISKSLNPDRLMSAGEILGMDLCRLARAMRADLCDWEDVIKGFTREMSEPY